MTAALQSSKQAPSVRLPHCRRRNGMAELAPPVGNYLKVNARYGTNEDLERFVEEAHRRDMRVFLDIVLHHSGDGVRYVRLHLEPMQFVILKNY